MNDYTSFGSVPIEGRPWSPASGVDAAVMDYMRQQAQTSTLEQLFTQNQQRKAELERYQGLTPAELAKSRLQGEVANRSMEIPGYGRSMGLGEMGKAGTEQAKGTYDLSTLGTHIGAGNSENLSKGAGSRLKEFEAINDMLNSHVPTIEAANSQSPLAGQMRYQHMLQQIPEQHRDIFPQQWGEQAKQVLSQVRANLENNIGQQRAMTLEKEKTRSAAEVADIHGQYQVLAAQERAAARVKSLMDNFQAAKTPNTVIMYGEMILADPAVSESTKTVVRAGVDKAYTLRGQELGRGGFDINNLKGGPADVGGTIEQRLRSTGMGGGTGLRPQTNTGIPGVVRK